MSDHDGAASLVRSDALLGCPFCGSPDSLEIREYRFRGFSEWRIVCTPSLCGCGAEGPVASEHPQAIDHWNQRATIQPNAESEVSE